MAKARSNRQRAIEAIESRVVPLSDSSPYLKLLFYGKNGRGKTTAAVNAPNPIVLDCNEEGTESVTDKAGDFIPIKTWTDFVWAYWFLKSGNHKYKTVVIDTVTMLQDICITHVLKEGFDRDPNKDPKMMSQPLWGKLAQTMNPEMISIRNLPMHVVFVAQERQFDNEEDESIERVPDCTPKIRNNLTSMTGLIGHFRMKAFRRGKGRKEKIEYHPVMLAGPDDVYTASKSRVHGIPRLMVDPSVNKILAMREAYKKGK